MKELKVTHLFLQAAVTAARFFAVYALLDVSDWGVFTFPFQSIANLLMLAGFVLNGLVYLRLGICGVYYGSALGVEMPWCTQWPYGPNGIPHPQVRI